MRYENEAIKKMPTHFIGGGLVCVLLIFIKLIIIILDFRVIELVSTPLSTSSPTIIIYRRPLKVERVHFFIKINAANEKKNIIFFRTFIACEITYIIACELPLHGRLLPNYNVEDSVSYANGISRILWLHSFISMTEKFVERKYISVFENAFGQTISITFKKSFHSSTQSSPFHR